jgi:hypothetical protein
MLFLCRKIKSVEWDFTEYQMIDYEIMQVSAFMCMLTED